MLRGMIMDRPLLISSILDYAVDYFGAREVVSVTADDPAHRTCYRELGARAKRLANALSQRFGVKPGDRVATLAWNDHRHLEIYYGVSGIGAVCHTINPRLFADQIVYIVNHAADRLLFADPMFWPLIRELAPKLPSLEHIVLMTTPSAMPAGSEATCLDYETVLSQQSSSFIWPELDDKTASGLCYTSGTTGVPKGVLAHHRSTVLHSLSIALPNALGIGADDVVLPVVPMFHVNAWGLPYACPMTGAKMVMPGPKLDGASLSALFEREEVTLSAGVPTIWAGLLDPQAGKKLSALKSVVIGGSAAPLAMIKRFEEEHDVLALHGWGMTEMGPVGTICRLGPAFDQLDRPAKLDCKVKQGRPLFGVDVKIVDDAGEACPHDGETAGLLMVRGPWITSGYFGDDAANAEAFDGDGWFKTGDVATMDADGFVLITDRVKDMIKSGGEWISSIALENLAVGHPAVAEAAAIGVRHETWGERPLLIIVKQGGRQVTASELITYLQSRIAKWQLPDDVLFVDELPHTATGKIQKAELRDRFQNHLWPSERDDG